ncbi:MAG: hypothetical protein ACLTXM_07505 [Enterococcus sp.]
MKKIKCWFDTRNWDIKNDGVLELPDHLTKEQINQVVTDYLLFYVNIGWKELKEDGE